MNEMPPVRTAITIFTLLLGTGMLTGCDKLSGTAEQKVADAEAIGYACRVSGKSPEDCMKENDSFSPSDILDGWKNAAEDIKNKVASEGGNKSAEEKPVEKPAEKPIEKPVEKPAGDGSNKDGKAAADAKGSSH